MRNFFSLVLLGIFIFTLSNYAQKHSVTGKVIDRATGEKIGFATIRVIGKTIGTTANADGQYDLKLNDGTYKLVASCLGYSSDSMTISFDKPSLKMDFKLTQLPIHLPGVTVTPGMNPANAIIQKAIERKIVRNTKLHSYEYFATSKGVARAPEEFKMGDNTASIKVGYSDTSLMKIGAIFESQVKGYYQKPNKLKEEIIARKQTANLPPNVNTLTGGRLIQNFYSDDIKFFNFTMVSPLSDDALNYYYFYILDTLMIDHQPVYKIHMSPADTLDPGFLGEIYIEGDSYNLKQVDFVLNKASNQGGLFDTVKIAQQFLGFGDENIYMPVDYRLNVGIKYFKLFKLNFDFQTVLYEYSINPVISEDVFSKAILTVKTDADKKDSTFWNSVQSITVSAEESNAYKEIDSIKTANKLKKEKFDLVSMSYQYNENLSLPAPLGMYRFNRVEGHTIKSEFTLSDILDKRFNSGFISAYGFSDKRWKENLNFNYALGDYRTTKLKLSFYHGLNYQFDHPFVSSELITSLVNHLSYLESDQYYYSGGLSFSIEHEIFPVLIVKFGYQSNTDESAISTSPPPIFYPKKRYNNNNAIADGVYRFFTAEVKFDFRDYIEDGMFRRRLGGRNEVPVITIKTIVSDENILSSDMKFITNSIEFRGSFNSFASTSVAYLVRGYYSNGAVPYQYLMPVPGNTDGLFDNFSARTLGMNKLLGDRGIFAGFEYTVNKELWRFLHLSPLQKWDINLSVFGSASLSSMSIESKSIALMTPVEFRKHPFVEAGFGIFHPLLPVILEFAWKLNYRGENNFRVGVQTPFN